MIFTVDPLAITSDLLATLRALNDPGTPPLTARVSGLRADKSGRIYVHRFAALTSESNEPNVDETARIKATLAPFVAIRA